MTPLAAIRVRKKLSRARVAVDLDVDYSHLYRIERGEAKASPDLAKRLATYYGGEITLDQILFPEDYAGGETAAQKKAS